MTIIQTTAILSFLSIFGITAQVYADSVKSMKNTVNQEIIMKIDENKVALQKKAKAPSSIRYSDYGEIIVSSPLDLSFSKNLEERKGSLLVHAVDKVIDSYDFFQNAWREKFLKVREVAEVQASSRDMDPSQWESYSIGNKYFEERKILETFKLLQLKKEEISKGICMGFRFSFNPVSGHMFLEMNVTPSFEKRSGITIPF